MPTVSRPPVATAERWTVLGALAWLTLGSAFVACTSDAANPPPGTGGTPAGTGGASSGGATQSTGSGGATGTGGTTSASGGSGTGGASPAASGGATAAGGSANSATGGISGAGGVTHTGVWKVMPFGDSVTGSTCYPQILSKDLIAGGHTNFQFVGTVTNNSSCGNGTPSVKTEGHGGYGVTFLPSTSTRPRCTKQAQGCGSFAELQTWAAEKPDMVLMHYATNDCWDGQSTAAILSAYLAVIAEFRKQNPNVIFFVSKIIPLDPAPAGSVNPMNVINLNAALTPAWASANSTPTSMIRIIDHFTGFNPATDTVDGVHPNPAGAQKMSTASFNALAAAAYF